MTTTTVLGGAAAPPEPPCKKHERSICLYCFDGRRQTYGQSVFFCRGGVEGKGECARYWGCQVCAPHLGGGGAQPGNPRRGPEGSPNGASGACCLRGLGKAKQELGIRGSGGEATQHAGSGLRTGADCCPVARGSLAGKRLGWRAPGLPVRAGQALPGALSTRVWAPPGRAPG